MYFYSRKMIPFATRRLLSTVPRVGEFPEKINPVYLQDPGKYLHEINRARHERMGPMYCEKIGPDLDIVYIADPGVVKKIFSLESQYPRHFVPQAWAIYGDTRHKKRGLFFLDGPDWLQMRRLLNPILLDKDSIRNFEPFIVEEVERFIKDIEVSCVNPPRNSSQSYRVVKNLPMELHRWSVRTILAVIYGNSDIFTEEEERRLIENVQIIFDVSARLQFTSALEACQQNTPDWKEFSCAADKVFDLLGNSLNTKFVTPESLSGRLMYQGVQVEDIERIAMDFIIAAVDTTSISTLWTIHLLSQETQIQNDVRTSKDDKLLRHCIKETSRLYPVSPFITRILEQDLDIDGSIFQPGQLILFSTYTMSRNSNYFRHPEDFIPSRWDNTPSSFASIPFGFRARSCIGKKLAEVSMERLIKKLVSTHYIHSLNYERAEMIMKYIGLPDRTIKIGLEKI